MVATPVYHELNPPKETSGNQPQKICSQSLQRRLTHLSTFAFKPCVGLALLKVSAHLVKNVFS